MQTCYKLISIYIARTTSRGNSPMHIRAPDNNLITIVHVSWMHYRSDAQLTGKSIRWMKLIGRINHFRGRRTQQHYKCWPLQIIRRDGLALERHQQIWCWTYRVRTPDSNLRAAPLHANFTTTSFVVSCVFSTYFLPSCSTLIITEF